MRRWKREERREERRENTDDRTEKIDGRRRDEGMCKRAKAGFEPKATELNFQYEFHSSHGYQTLLILVHLNQLELLGPSIR